ncbi:MAG TPA: AMP-binding protein, partial [Gaiellaceae bacterium]|nr:AMP-binding protein [Gaiellaceae bacterium]
MTTAELIRRGAKRYSERTAVLCGDATLTFAEVDDLANRIANVLLACGVDRVGLLLGNGLHSIPIDFACAKAGIARVPLNTRLAPPEQQAILDIAGAALTVTDREADLDTELLSLDELLERACRAPSEEPAHPGADDTVLLLATSGTTGKLKLVRHTQRTWAAIAVNILANLVDPQTDDVMLHAASLIHASGTFVLPFWDRGAAAAVLPGFVPAEFLEAADRYGATATNVVPTMLGALLQEDEHALPALRTIVYGASPAPRAIVERSIERFGPILVQYYGQTEAPLCITVLRPEDHVGERVLSCGFPSVDAEVRLDEETGEILVRAPFTAAGYHGDEQLHRETFLDDGWVRTRDVGRLDERGYLYLVDRTSDMIVTGGYNVYPREVEDALASHPAVREVVVVGAPDPKWVETVTAFVVAEGATEAELIAHCRERVAAYKAPTSVRFIDEIPKSPVGKLLRRALRDPLWEGHERPI